jgi:hypothetical protein
MMSIQTIEEDEMVATFLKAEINSPRWKESITNSLAQYGKDRRLIDQPDLMNADDNVTRSHVLGSYRGYKLNKYLFTDFPNDVQWQKVVLDIKDLRCIRYLKNCPAWSELSGGTLLAADAARRIQDGIINSEEVIKVINDIRSAVELLKNGQSFPEIILVAQSDFNQPIVLEGHVRLTAYLLVPSGAPISAILGHSSSLWKWERLW